MAKLISAFKEYDPQLAGLTEHTGALTVNRVTDVLRGNAPFAVLVETWCVAPKTFPEPLLAGSGLVFAALVDEVFVSGGDDDIDPADDRVYKTFSAYHLPEDVNQDEFWSYHTDIHGKDVVEAAGPMLLKYRLNRIEKRIAGSSTFFGIIEMWWRDKEAQQDYPAKSASFVTASGKCPIDDYRSRGPISEYSIAAREEIVRGATV